MTDSASLLVLAGALGVRAHLLSSVEAVLLAARSSLVEECLSRQAFVPLDLSSPLHSVSEEGCSSSWWDGVEVLLEVAGAVLEEAASLHASGVLDPYLGCYLLPDREARSEVALLSSLVAGASSRLGDPSPAPAPWEVPVLVEALVLTLWGALTGRLRPAPPLRRLR